MKNKINMGIIALEEPEAPLDLVAKAITEHVPYEQRIELIKLLVQDLEQNQLCELLNGLPTDFNILDSSYIDDGLYKDSDMVEAPPVLQFTESPYGVMVEY